MNRNLFQIIYPFLDKLSLGKTLRSIVYWLWKISAVIYGIFALYLIFQILSNAHDFGKFLLGIIACILIVLAWWIIAQIYFYRADKVKQLADSDFTVIPIIAQMLRLAGEILAALIIISAVIVVLVGGYFGYQYLNLLPYFSDVSQLGGNSVVALLIVILSGVGYAFFFLIFFYFLAEIVSVGVTIAQNSIAIRELLSNGAVIVPEDIKTMADERTEEVAKDVELRCDNCDNIVSADDVFCMNCGTKLK
jgi:hypothetical protein